MSPGVCEASPVHGSGGRVPRRLPTSGEGNGEVGVHDRMLYGFCMNKRQQLVGRAQSAHLMRVVSFLRGIGIPSDVVPGAKGFMPGVRIHQGGLQISPEAALGDVLHEAGHLAVLPGRFRRLACDDVSVVQRLMLDTVDFSNPDVGEARAALQSGDAEATAWAWAAGEYLELDRAQVVRNRDYGGAGRDVRISLEARAYLGINGLASAGFCVTRPGPLEKMRGLPAYPRLAMWVQRDFDAVTVGMLSAA